MTDAALARLHPVRPLTLKAIQQYARERFTDKLLADIDAELAKRPPKK